MILELYPKSVQIIEHQTLNFVFDNGYDTRTTMVLGDLDAFIVSGEYTENGEKKNISMTFHLGSNLCVIDKRFV